MRVRDLIDALEWHDPEAEVHICTEHESFFGGTTEVSYIYESTATYGLLRPDPTTVKTVVLDTVSCGI